MGVAVTFDDDNATVAVEPGGEVACRVRVENTGSVVDGILLDLLGDAAEWGSVEPAEVNLLPGASAQARIVFRPPRSAELTPGEVPFGLRAMSREDPDGSQIEEGVVQVGEFSDLTASLVPKSATGRRSARFRLIVENRGNRLEHMTVQAADPDVKLAFRPRPQVFTARAGTATFVRLSASPRKTFFKGPNRTLPFQVSAQPDGGDPVTADGVMLEKQTLPEWLLPVLGIAVVLAGLILALWLAVLRPVVHSAATAAADAGKAARSAKSAAQAANSHKSAPPSALDVTLASPTILARTTELATVTGSFPGASGGAVPALVWTSSAPKIAKVSQSGVVTGMRPGSATITATTATKAPASAAPASRPTASPRGTSLDASVLDASGASKSAVLSGSVTVNVVGKLRIASTALPEAALGKPYSPSLNASGGTGSFTWSISGGSLPAGLSLSPASGGITGTPTALRTSSFVVHLADAGPPTQFATRRLAVTVVKPLAVQTSSLAGGTVGGRYAQRLAAVGGTPGYRWSIGPGTGALPGGLRLNPATGAITGTPTSAGVSNFVVQVFDSASPSQSSTEALSVTVVSPLTLSTLTVPTGVLDTPYSAALTAFGGTASYTWSVSAGSLPAGLTLGPTSGTITGTPGSAGASTFTIQVVDASQPGQSVSRTFTLSVVHGLNVTTTSLPHGLVGQSYTAQLTATGGVAPYVWSPVGTLPPGLSLSPGGVITGTPTATGIFSLTVQAVDSASPPLSVTASLSVTVLSPLRISTTSLPEAVTGVSYTQAIGAVGGSPPYTWSVIAGSLPRGLNLSSSTGAISGTALATGTFALTVSVTDSDTPTARSASLSTSITVVEPLTFTEPTLATAVEGVTYHAVTPSHVSGGSGSYLWSITSGALPAGLSLDQSTGTISGLTGFTATLGAQNFTLTVADATDPSLTTSQPETINVNPGLKVVLPKLTVVANNSFLEDLSNFVSGGLPPYTFSATVIDNLSVNPTTGLLSGIPDAACSGGTATTSGSRVEVKCPSTSFTKRLIVKDANGSVVGVNIRLTATVAPLVVDYVPSLPDLHDLSSYDQATVNAAPTGGYGTGGLGGYVFSTSAAPNDPTNNNGLPCNLGSCSTGGEFGIDSSTGEIKGEITSPSASGTKWTFNVIVTDTDPLDTNNTITASFQLSITES